jgi:DNA-binding NtrC family response regulator
MPAHILVVDEEPLKRITLQLELSERGYEVSEAADARAARRILESQRVDVVITELRLPEMSGLDLLTHIREHYSGIDVLLMSPPAPVETVVRAIKRGAYDYLCKPFTTQDLAARLERLLSTRAPGQRGAPEPADCGGLVTCSQVMRGVFERLRQAAQTDEPVLLCGETGTGKTALAEALHALGPRAAQPLVRCVCSGRPADELERELCGTDSEPGRNRAGRFEQARGGTLLLEDVAELPPTVQTRLLALLTQSEGTGDGGRTLPRLIATTRRELSPAGSAGVLLDALYERLNVFAVTLPPLRERPADVALLAQHFAARHAQLAGGRPVTLTPAALEELLRREWPGNVRELEHALERAVAFCGGPEIRPEHVVAPQTVATDAGPPLPPAPGPRQTLAQVVTEVERRMIQMALRQCDGNQARAAERLGIPRTTLRDKLTKYNLT